VGTHVESDEVLLARVREDGDRTAFACLYTRYAPAARQFARSLCGNDADADDITADVFTSLFASLRRGRGPSELALPYLFASLRNRHRRTAGRRAHEAELVRTVGERSSTGCESTAIVEADAVRTALATLPNDVQSLLWCSEVDGDPGGDVLGGDGVSAHTRAVHRHRARRALGTAYLAQHAEPDGGLIGLAPECRATLPHLASLVRNRIGVRRRRRVEKHLAECEQCEQVRERLELINTRLRAHPLPWTMWSAGLTSILKAQVTDWLGTSAVTIAGSGALAMAVLVPVPISLEPTNDTESRPAPTAGWTAREEGGPSRDSSAGSRMSPGETALASGKAGGESNWFRMPTSDLPTTPASRAAGEDQESTTTARTSADMPADATPRDGATFDAVADALAADDNRAPAAGEDGTDGDQDDDDKTESGDCQGSGLGTARGTAVGGRAGCGGKGQSNTDEDNQGPSNGNGDANGPGASIRHGQGEGQRDSKVDGHGDRGGSDALSGQDNGGSQGSGPGSASGHGSGPTHSYGTVTGKGLQTPGGQGTGRTPDDVSGHDQGGRQGHGTGGPEDSAIDQSTAGDRSMVNGQGNATGPGHRHEQTPADESGDQASLRWEANCDDQGGCLA
jgi:DNA-directed RNA polymerase specialized sigma24 family protein